VATTPPAISAAVVSQVRVFRFMLMRATCIPLGREVLPQILTHLTSCDNDVTIFFCC
jgi:hypothetical protein